jgi:hypothetical protein
MEGAAVGAYLIMEVIRTPRIGNVRCLGPTVPRMLH